MIIKQVQPKLLVTSIILPDEVGAGSSITRSRSVLRGQLGSLICNACTYVPKEEKGYIA